MRRIVPDLHTSAELIGETTRFYRDILGMVVAMDIGWIVNLSSPDNPTAQLQLLTDDASAPVTPNVSIEVDDLDAVLQRALKDGADIVYGPAYEPWGVRRFFVRDPSGAVINVMVHAER